MKVSKKAFLIGAVVALVATPGAYAATSVNSQLTQSIKAGTLSTSIKNASGADVASPSFAMSEVTVSPSVQTSTGTYGDDAQRIYVDNGGAANSGWTLSLAGATSANWSNGTANYPFNATTAAAGQLTVTPTAGTMHYTGSSNSTGITTSAAATFSDTVSSVTLIDAAAASQNVWNGYITGIGLSQTIPANTDTGNYTLNMVQTVVAK